METGDARELTVGQREALAQLRRIAARVPAAIRVHPPRRPAESDGDVTVRVDLNCTALTVVPESGFRPRDWETVLISVSPGFPYVPPVAELTNREFATLTNVMWGRYLCLYLSDNDWQPDAGMWGFVDRLTTWFLRAAANELTSPGLRWHPPAMDWAREYPGLVIFGVDLPPGTESTESFWLAWAAFTRIKTGLYEVQRWVSRPDAPGVRDDGRTTVAPFLALPRPIGFWFPRTVGALIGHLRDQDVPPSDIQALLANAARWTGPAAEEDEEPIGPVILIGSPAPAGEAAPGRVAHIVAWRVPPGAAAGRADDAPVHWVRVDDQRPSATRRRDHSRPARWLADRRILLLGCGALGAPIAEHCVRAGVRSIVLVDKGTVTPGLLVRQPYEDGDIGESKVQALGKRLKRIDPTVKVEVSYAALPIVFGQWPEVDLMIDATANRAVAVAIERVRQHIDRSPPVLSVFVGHEADRGIATLALPGAGGAGVDILRRLAVDAATDDDLVDVLDDFFPDPPRTTYFQPAPGCSDPTFVGSSADLSALASQLLNAGTSLLAEADRAETDREPAPNRSATVVQLPTLRRPSSATHRRQWLDDVVRSGPDGAGPQVRIDRAAMATIRRLVARSTQADVDSFETGGALLGQIDMASGVVWVTEVLDLPPGGHSSESHVTFDLSKVDELIADRRTATRGMVRLIGAWHSHPTEDVRPSDADRATMARMTAAGNGDSLTRALLLIVAPDATWSKDRRLQMYVEMFS